MYGIDHWWSDKMNGFHIACRVTMEEAKEVHTNLRNAAGIFKFVKVLPGKCN